MALEIKFTKENLLERNQLEPAWYTVVVKAVKSQPGKSDPTSTTYKVELEVCEGPQAGTPVVTYFTEKLLSRVADFIRCFVTNVEPNKGYDLEDTVGRKLKAYIKYDIAQRWNTVEDYRPNN
jgi:hypothetical protein